ncbi:MAG: enoyl-CoA hydratase, partial [Planctomycetes bacterium]|nr:enoyl-CoA hydratase [Planctomycetota bacterium]
MNNVIIDKPKEHITVITLNRPERLNAMSAELIGNICDAFRQVGADNDTRVVVITGAGKAFCSGLDLEDHGMVPGVDGMTLPQIGMRSIEHFAQPVPVMRDIPQPVIAAINGSAYGGGMCLALGADIRVAEKSTVFNATGIVNGLTSTELGASYLLPRLIGSSRAFDILLTGRTVDAVDAERIGLVSRILPDGQGLTTALEIAEKMC